MTAAQTRWPTQERLAAPVFAFGGVVLEAERRLVSAGCHNPAGLWEAARVWCLTGSMFCDSSCGAVFCVVLACAKLNEPATLATVKTVAVQEGARADDVDAMYWLECSGAGVGNCAAKFFSLYARRLGALHLINEADGLIRGGLPPADAFGPFADALQEPAALTMIDP